MTVPVFAAPDSLLNLAPRSTENLEVPGVRLAFSLS